MLATSTYTQDHIDRARGLISAAPADQPDTLVLALDRCFVHRLRNREDSNGPAKQLRALADGILDGTPSGLDETSFRSLADDFFQEIARSYA
jgi:hypothetical protein